MKVFLINADSGEEDITLAVALTREKQFKDNRTNKEKIISNGFDTKTSFRKM